jgi:type IV secretion system protein VirD4
VQSLSQLKAIYKENLETITDNCDSLLFLGGKGSGTLKEISEMLGKETIDLMTATDTRGQSPSYSTNFQKAGRELMSKDEIASMDGGMCIFQLRGVRPFFSKKYDITKHLRYKHLADADEKNALGVKAYVRYARRGLGHSICGKEDIVEYYLVT